MTMGPRRPSQYWVERCEWYQNVPEEENAVVGNGYAKCIKQRELTGLIGYAEVVGEGIVGGNGAFANESNAFSDS